MRAVTAAERRTFAGDRRRAVAFPLGGIGTGNLALGGTGALKQWQLHNQGNHLGFAPQSFFALRLSCTEPPLSFRRVLRGPAIAPHREPAPLVNDDLDAAGPYARPASWPLVRDTTFGGAYPFARVDYADDWPAEVRLEAYTPFVPLDAEASGLPLASFTFRITNQFGHPLHGWLLGALQNLVGWDGVTPVRDDHCAVLGGNVNRLMAAREGTGAAAGQRRPGPGPSRLRLDGTVDPGRRRRAPPVRRRRRGAGLRRLAEAGQRDRARRLERAGVGPRAGRAEAGHARPARARARPAAPGRAPWRCRSACSRARPPSCSSSTRGTSPTG